MPSDEPPVFDGGSPRTRKRILYQLNERLKMEPGVNYTRFDPSRITPEAVIASITPTEFLGESYPAPYATLVVWWSPRVASKDHFSIQWYETPDREEAATGEEVADPTLPEVYTLSCGWHFFGSSPFPGGVPGWKHGTIWCNVRRCYPSLDFE